MQAAVCSRSSALIPPCGQRRASASSPIPSYSTIQSDHVLYRHCWMILSETFEADGSEMNLRILWIQRRHSVVSWRVTVSHVVTLALADGSEKQQCIPVMSLLAHLLIICSLVPHANTHTHTCVSTALWQSTCKETTKGEEPLMTVPAQLCLVKHIFSSALYHLFTTDLLFNCSLLFLHTCHFKWVAG